jgi:hypothetical protein
MARGAAPMTDQPITLPFGVGRARLIQDEIEASSGTAWYERRMIRPPDAVNMGIVDPADVGMEVIPKKTA